MRYHLLASLCIASLTLIANPAQAQKREYSPGLNYTTLGTTQKKKTETAEKPKLYNTIEPKPFKKAEPTEDVATAKPEESEEDAPKEDPTVTIWNKYKDLAAGTAGEKDSEDADKQATKTITPKKPGKPSVETPAAPATEAIEGEEKPAENAFGSILDQWRSSRDKQRDMRSKTFAVPDQKSN